MVLKGTVWSQLIDHIKNITSDHYKTEIDRSLGCKILNASNFGSYLLQLKTPVGPEVVGDIVELTIRSEPKHISYEALLFSPRFSPRQAHNFDVVTPLAGRIRWRCLVWKPGHQNRILNLHICYLTSYLPLAIMYEFQVRWLYK